MDVIDDPELHTYLVNAGDQYDVAWQFAEQFGVEIPVLLDLNETFYRAYPNTSDRYAPFPLQVVVDRNGGITYLARQYNTDAVLTAIRNALAE